MSLNEEIAQAKLTQRKGQMVEAAEQAGIPTGNQQPTEYAKSAKLVVDKMFDPYDEDDKQLLSRIPKPILPNTMMLVGIEHAIDKLYSADVELISSDGKKVFLYNYTDTQQDIALPDGTTHSNNGLMKYRTVTMKGYIEGKFWKQYWHGFIGGLFQQLPAVDGKSRDEGVATVSAITNSDRALLEAQNNANANWFTKQFHKVFK